MLFGKWARAAALLLMVLAGWSATAHAEDRLKAREAYRRATNAYDFGEYASALAAFKEAYGYFEDPNILFNIAQCHRQLGQSLEAIRVYRSYLRHVPRSPNSEEVRQIVARLEQTLAEENANRQQPPHGTIDAGGAAKSEAETSSAGTPPPPAPAPAAQPTPPPRQAAAPVLVDAHAGRRLRSAGVGVAAVGVGALVAGIALEALAKQTSDDLTALDRRGGQYDPTKQARGESYNIAGPVLLGIGGAAVVASSVVALIGVRAKHQRVAVLPSVGPQGAGVTAKVAF
jgi:tetratricopeptide (TPR) repeat protein